MSKISEFQIRAVADQLVEDRCRGIKQELDTSGLVTNLIEVAAIFEAILEVSSELTPAAIALQLNYLFGSSNTANLEVIDLKNHIAQTVNELMKTADEVDRIDCMAFIARQLTLLLETAN